MIKNFILIVVAAITSPRLGMTTDGLKSLTLSQHTSGIEALDPNLTAKKYLPKLREAGAQLIVAVTHMGLNASDPRKQVSVINDDVKLAKMVPEISVIIGGHSHTLLPSGIREGETLIAQAGEKNEYLGRVDLYWDKKEQKVARLEAQVIPLDLAKGESADVKNLLAGYWNRASKQFDLVIGETVNDLQGDASSVRTQETNLGNLVCDVIRQRVKTDIAVFNGGGIRSTIRKGPIKLRDVYRTFPFKNTIATAKFTPQGIRKLLDSAIRHRLQAGGSFLQVSGIPYTVKENRVDKIYIGKREISSFPTVTLATNNFVMTGGDRLEIEADAANIHDTGILVSTTMVDYIKKAKRINAKAEGRVTWKD